MKLLISPLFNVTGIFVSARMVHKFKSLAPLKFQKKKIETSVSILVAIFLSDITLEGCAEKIML